MRKIKPAERMDFMLVEIIGKRYEEKLTTSSLKVADHFEKEHKDVLETIRNLTAENSAAKFFRETTYKNRGKEYPMCLINCGWGYDQIKIFIQENSPRMLAG